MGSGNITLISDSHNFARLQIGLNALAEGKNWECPLCLCLHNGHCMVGNSLLLFWDFSKLISFIWHEKGEPEKR